MRSANDVVFTKNRKKYHVFNAITNSELTELVPVFTTRPAFPTSVEKTKHIIQKCLADMGTGITDIIGQMT
jgi:hypothetical protein